MNITKVWGVLFVLVITCFSCTDGDGKQNLNLTAENLYNSPFPSPEFITTVGYPRDGCITISQKPFWEPGHNPTELFDHLVTNMQFELGGNRISDSDVSLVVAPMVYPVYDKEDEIQGFYGGPITTCINDTLLEQGLNFARIHLIAFSGKEYSHEWAFQIGTDSQSTPMFQILPTLSKEVSEPIELQ